MDIPAALIGLCGHRDFGIYLSVAEGGEIVVGDTVTRHEPAQAALAV
jgi:MOSC domain-containing protein YiiM